jgi:hypothetical protein
MAKKKKNRITLQFDQWNDYAKKLDELGGSQLLMQGVEAGLKASKQYVNDELKKVAVTSKYPQKGKYSTGLTADSIDNHFEVEWEGLTGWIKVGFDFSVSGLRTIMLMYGTPSMQPVKGLKSAIYGTKSKKNIGALQQEAIDKVISRCLSNG